MEPTPNGVHILDTDIGNVSALDVFRLDAETERERDLEHPDHILVTFENGPGPAEYDRVALQLLLDRMSMSCGEGDILRKIKIVPGFMGITFPAHWEDVVLFDGNGNYLVHPVSLDEVAVVLIAKSLHDEKLFGERHAVVVLRRSDLPEDWKPGDSIEAEFMMNTATIVINHNNVYLLSSGAQHYKAISFGDVHMAKRQQRDSHSFTMYTSTRLRPPMP